MILRALEVILRVDSAGHQGSRFSLDGSKHKTGLDISKNDPSQNLPSTCCFLRKGGSLESPRQKEPTEKLASSDLVIVKEPTRNQTCLH